MCLWVYKSLTLGQYHCTFKRCIIVPLKGLKAILVKTNVKKITIDDIYPAVQFFALFIFVSLKKISEYFFSDFYK